MARRRFDPDARDARLARRERPHRLRRRLLPGLPGGRRPGSPQRDRLPGRAAVDEVEASFARFGLERACASCPASSRRRCRRWRAAAGRSSGSTATPTRRPGCARVALPRPRGRRPPDRRRLPASCRVRARGRRVPRAARDRASRSRTSTGRASAGGARTTRRSRARPAGRHGRDRRAACARSSAASSATRADRARGRARARARRAARRAASGCGASTPAPAAGCGASHVIAFGSAITRPDVYAHCAAPGIRRAAEPDSVVHDLPSARLDLRELQRAARACRRARRPRGARARPPGRGDRRRRLLRRRARARWPTRTSASWAASAPSACAASPGGRARSLASFVHRYAEHGGGDLPAFSWSWDEAPPYARIGEVDTLDGFLLVLPPWTVRNVRFDESLGTLHGYDFDFCLQVREAGRKVITADFRAIHHHSLELFSDPTSGSRRTCASPRSGTAGSPGIGTAPGDVARAGARAPRPSATRRGSWTTRRAAARARGSASSRRDRRDHAAASPGASPRRCGAGRLASARPRDRLRHSIAEPEAYRATREPGIQRAAEPDSAVLAFAAVGPIARSYNMLLDAAAAARRPRGARARAPAHRDRRPRFCAPRPRDAHRPRRRVAGCGGARRRAASPGGRARSARLRRPSLRGARRRRAARVLGWARPTAPPGRVDIVDGALLVLSPWAVRTAALRRGAAHRLRVTTPTSAGRCARPAARS